MLLKVYQLCSYCYYVYIFSVVAVIVPTDYSTLIRPTPVNGSFNPANCNETDSTQTPFLYQCNCGIESCAILDQTVPYTLTELDGDMWASQLLTLQTTAAIVDINFDFGDNEDFDGLMRAEIVMFNCPQWRIGAQAIGMLVEGEMDVGLAYFEVDPTIASCDSLVRVCTPVTTTSPVLTLRFLLNSSASDWVHLAGVTFWDDDSPCPPDSIINGSSPTSEVTVTSKNLKNQAHSISANWPSCSYSYSHILRVVTYVYYGKTGRPIKIH